MPESESDSVREGAGILWCLVYVKVVVDFRETKKRRARFIWKTQIGERLKQTEYKNIKISE